MSNQHFPVLPGLKFPVGKEPMWETSKFPTAAGREYRSSYWTYPKWLITLEFEFIQRSTSDYGALVGFFNYHGGDRETFLYDDPDDNTVTAASFGLGDGTTTQFALTHAIGAFSEPVGYATPSQITVNASPTSAYTLLSNRMVQFTAPPASGAVLAWSGTFAYRTRFYTPNLPDLKQFMVDFFSTGQLKLITDKP